MEPMQGTPTKTVDGSVMPDLEAMNHQNDGQGTGSSSAVTYTPAAAEDSELIEPEWVGAVKQVMQRHHDDPYALAQAMAAVREDYLMKRYGRNLGPA